MLAAAQAADDPPECQTPDDAQDDSNPATRLRFSLPLDLSCFPEKG